MSSKVLFRTAKKLGILFGSLASFIFVVFLGDQFGKYFFTDGILGTIIILGSICLLSVIYFAYKDAKYEVENENNKLIQELTKHG